MPAPNPTTTATNPRVLKLIELETSGRIKPEHQTELDTYRAQGLAPKKVGGTAPESERTAAFLGANVGTAMLELEEINKRNPAALRPQVGAQLLGGDKSLGGNWANVPDRRQASGAQDLLLDAALTLGTGAAYNKEQFENYRAAYLPNVFDDDTTIKAKSRRMRALLENARIKAGGSSGDIDRAMAAFGFSDDATNGADEPSTSVEAGENVVATNDGSGEFITPEDRELSAQLRSALEQGAGRADLDAILARYGRPPFDPKVVDPVIKARDEGRPYAVDVTASGRKEPSALGAMAASPVGAYAASAGDAVTLGFQDELAGVLGGDTGQARLALDLGRREHGIASGLGSLTGGALIPIGRGATTMRELAGVGGGLGAAYGFGSGTTAEERVGGAALGGVTGAALGAGFSKLGDVWRRRGGSGAPPTGGGANEVATASRDLDVPMMPGDVGGTPFSFASSVARMTPGGAQPITAAARRSQEAGGAALSRIASAEGQALDREAAGEAVRRGALNYRDTSRRSIGGLYDQAAEEAGDAKIAPNQALARLDQHIAELSEVPGGSEGLSVLQGLRDELASRGTLSVNGIRGMRTQLRQKFAKDGLRGSDIERRVNEVVEAAAEDLVQSLNDQGNDVAAKAYANADRQWAERIKTLDDTIIPIIGKRGEKSGEQITDALNRAAKGNNARLSKLFDTLPPEEAGTARATLIEGLGRSNASGQNAAGDAFSFNTFLTNWNKVGNSAKNAMFSGENRKAIDQLALLAEKSKNASRWQNYSNTGLAVLSAATGGTSGVGFLAGAPGVAATVGAQYALGRLLASPVVAKGLLKIAQAKTPDAIRARVGNLSSIAAKDAALAPEITGLQQRLLSAINDNAPTRAAASQDEHNQR